jgi:putative Holliday junction resolvase
MKQYPVILAIDFGTKRVGVAISRGSLAEPLTILPQNEGVFSALLKIFDAERVEKIVVGMSENEMAVKTAHFIEQLKTKTNLPLEIVDETLSSHTVQTNLKESGASLRVRQRPIDDRAAATFLQEYLDDQEMVY